MKRILFVFSMAALPALGWSQQNAELQDTSWKKIFRESDPRVNNLVHTKLDVKFDYDKSYLYGKEWLTLKPHFYPTDSVLLDAKAWILKRFR